MVQLKVHCIRPRAKDGGRVLGGGGGYVAVFWETKVDHHSTRSTLGWLWTDLDGYASYAPVMHATLVVLP